MEINYSQLPSPAFLLHEKKLLQNLELLQQVQKEAGIEILMALKAFAFWPVFPLVRKYLSGASASSLNEARLIYEEMGVPAHTYAPVFRPQEFEEIIKYSSHIIFNSLNQYHRYIDQVKRTEHHISLGLRVNPLYSTVDVDLYNPCAPGSRLGIEAKHLPEKLPEGIEGLHLHALCESEMHDTEGLLLKFEEDFSAWFEQISWINLGGGHLITRKNYNIQGLIKLLKSFREKYNLKIYLEPGSAIAWETGELITTVLDIIESAGIKTAIIDASFTAHMPDTLEMPYRPMIRGSSEAQVGMPTYRIGGLSCLAGDFIGDYSFEKELSIGDQLIFEDMIHYTMVKTTFFNGVQHPDICILRSNGSLEIQRSFGYSDFKNRLA